MFGWWIVAIISSVVTAIGIILMIIDGGWGNWYGLVGIVATLLGAISLLTSIFVGLIAPLEAKQEFEAFKITQEIVTTAYEQGKEYENATITTAIIEANKWYAEAKGNKATYGKFSKYWYIDFNEVSPISVSP